MSVFTWRFLRSDAKQHFAFLYAREYVVVRTEGGGLLSSSGCVVFHRDGIWVMASRHMDEDFIDLSFLESAEPLDWFDMADVVAALGIDIYAGGAPIAHAFQVKAPVLERFLPLVEEALAAD